MMNVLNYIKQKSRDLPNLSNIDIDVFFWKKPEFINAQEAEKIVPKEVKLDPRICRAMELESVFMPLLEAEIAQGEWFLLTQSHIDEFALLSGDKQWIHTDPDRCRRESPYRATIAHGLLVLSILPELAGINDIAEQHYDDAKFVLNCGLDRVTFINPARASSNIRAKTVLKKCKRQGRKLDITYRLIARNDDSRGNIVCEVDAVLRVCF